MNTHETTIAAIVRSNMPAEAKAAAIALLAGTVSAKPTPAPEAPKAPRTTAKGRTMGTKATEADMVKAARAYRKAHKAASAFTALKYGNADLYAGVVTKVQAREAGLPTTF